MASTIEQKLIDTQIRIQQASRKTTLRASFVPFPDFDPPPAFRRQALPTPPQFVAAMWQPAPFIADTAFAKPVHRTLPQAA